MINNINGLSALSQAIREHAEARPKERLVLANGASHVSLGEGVPITRQVLDTIISDRPLALYCFDHHIMWANTKALEVAGILRSRDLPPALKLSWVVMVLQQVNCVFERLLREPE
jgi:predicted amidohydrolase YtcJ